MITAQEYNEKSGKLDAIVDEASDNLHKVVAGRKGAMGLVSEEVRCSDEYKAAKKEFNIAFNALRTFAKAVPNKIKRDAALMRRHAKQLKQ